MPYSDLDLPCLGPRQGSGGLCRDCRDGSEKALDGLVGDFDALTGWLGRHPQPAGPASSGNKPGSRPPINVHIDALRSLLVYSAAIWEEIIRDHCGLSTRRKGAVRERQSLVRSVQILSPRVDLFVTLSGIDGYFDGPECGLVRRDGLDGLRHLVRLHKAVHRTLGYTAVVIQLPGACTCGAQTLRKETGSETVWCETCQGRWTYDDYTRHVRLMIQ